MYKKLLIVFIGIIVFTIVGITNVNAMTIVLDPGHGGNGAGESVGAYNENKKIYEKDINLKISLYLKNYLERYENINIIMTRTDDSELTVFERAMIARNANADLLVSLHTNDASDRENNISKGSDT